MVIPTTNKENFSEADALLLKAKEAKKAINGERKKPVEVKVPPQSIQEPLMVFAIALVILLDLTNNNEPNNKDEREVKLRGAVRTMRRAFSLYRQYHYWIFSTLDIVDQQCNIGNTNPLFFAIRMLDIHQEYKNRPIKIKIDTYDIIDEGIELLPPEVMTSAFEKADLYVLAIRQAIKEKDDSCQKSLKHA